MARAKIDMDAALELSDGSAVVVRSVNERFVEVCLQADVDRPGHFTYPTFLFDVKTGKPVFTTLDRGETRTLRNAK